MTIEEKELATIVLNRFTYFHICLSLILVEELAIFFMVRMLLFAVIIELLGNYRIKYVVLPIC